MATSPKNPFAKPAQAGTITTGVQGSVATDLQLLASGIDPSNLGAGPTGAPVEGAGYISYCISQFKLGGKKVVGIETEKGFFYPSSLGAEAMSYMKAQADRGFAYEFGASN